MDTNIGEKNADSTANSTKLTVIDITEAAGYDHKATRNLLRKLDWHIIPFMSLIYLSVTFIQDFQTSDMRC